MHKDPKTLDEAFSLVSQDLLEVFLKKHQDYGKGNILSIKELGIAMRLAEKIERLKHLLLKAELGDTTTQNESIEDTWTDIAVYAIIAQLYRNGWFQALEVEKSSKPKS
jgi:hypothetical protein